MNLLSSFLLHIIQLHMLELVPISNKMRLWYSKPNFGEIDDSKGIYDLLDVRLSSNPNYNVVITKSILVDIDT